MHQTKLASIQLILWNILKEYGHNPIEVFRRAQLDPELMKDPGARYPLSKIGELWKEICKVIQDPCFGLKTANHWHPTHFGTLGYAMLESQTIRQSLERIIRFHRVISDANFGKLKEDSDNKSLNFILNWDFDTHYPAPREDAAVTFLLSICRLNVQQDFSPVCVHLTHPEPNCTGEYYKFFRCPVTFNAPTCCLAIPLEVADRHLPGVDKELAAFKDQIIIKYIAGLNQSDLVSKVRKCITSELPSGNVTAKSVARELFMSTRTMQRLLQQEKTTFAKIMQQTRSELAKQYMRDKKLELTEVAFLLGFSELSTFSRSFKRLTGQSPSHYRRSS